MSARFARLGRYQPETLLGRNHVTETFRARLVEVLPGEKAQAFALKVLRQGEHRAEVELRFIAAARMLQRRPLPGTAGVFEIGDRPEAVFAAFQFEEGVNLRQLRGQAVPEGSRMDIRLVGTVARKLAERLVPLHAQPDGMRVHGGLSSGNVLVRPSGDILLLDCGFAEALRSRAGWPGESWRFAAPEQLRGEPAAASSDLYSLGALMYFLYYGHPPFAGDTPEGLEACIAGGPPELEGVHPSIAAIMARALSYAASARPRTAIEVVRQLSAALLSANAGVGALAQAPAWPAAAADGAAEAPTEVEPLAQAASVSTAEEGAGDDDSAIRPFALVPQNAVADEARGEIAADDPDVGVVYDDEDEEEIEVGADGKMKRRRRRGGIRILAWTKSAFARKLFRYAWVPIAIVLVVGGVEGYYLLKSWRAAREQSMLREAAAAAERARLEAAKPKLTPKPTIPKGNLVLKVVPAGAVVWLDGREAGVAPTTLATEPGSHRLVVTASGYRMLRDVIDTTNGALFEREMVPAIFPLSGSVGVNVACTTEGKYPVLVDGKEIGALCPIAGVRLDPGKHMIGVFVIPQNRIWTLEREIVADRPHRVHFNY
ncbi:MAG: PEGA domain-containing protein [Deltaproteobacteria bacterium]|nr:PEGA domain-containing protein [Deltaproteobacteria bacterium]